jgi:GTP-binding protein
MIRSAEFVISNTDPGKCPAPQFPEYAFIGRSNVGKSSLINALTGFGDLAKTSSKPGKTQLINHFIINKQTNPWYLVDLPGYGYAKASKSMKARWESFIYHYLETRQNLLCTFVLIDIRHPAQAIDMRFLEWMGEHGLPFVLVFTKADKLSKTAVEKNRKVYLDSMLEQWEEPPMAFLTSAEKRNGLTDILSFIEETNALMPSNPT